MHIVAIGSGRRRVCIAAPVFAETGFIVQPAARFSITLDAFGTRLFDCVKWGQVSGPIRLL